MASPQASAGSALPYIDTELDAPGMRERVRQLIEQEMQSFRPPRDYVAHIRVPELALEVRPARSLPIGARAPSRRLTRGPATSTRARALPAAPRRTRNCSSPR